MTLPALFLFFALQTHDEVRFLLYRLDFNEFRRRTLDEGLMGDDDMMVE